MRFRPTVPILPALALTIVVIASGCQLVETPTGSSSVGTGVFSADVDGVHRVYYATSRGYESHGGGMRGGMRTHSFTKSWLHCIDARTGAELATVSMKRSDRESGESPALLGITGDRLWVWQEGLQCRDLRTLETQATSEDVVRANPELERWIPQDSKYFGPAAAGDALWFQALDGRHFALDPTSLRATELTGAADTEARQAATSWMFRTRNSIYTPMAVSSDNEAQAEGVLLEDGWFGLMNRDQWEYHQTGIFPNWSAQDPRKEWYRADQEPSGSSAPGLRKVHDRAFLQAGLLKHPRHRDAWTLESPTSVLLLHRETIETDTPWLLGRMTLDGAFVWNVPLTIGDLEYVIDAGKSVLILGTPRLLDNEDRFCAVDLETGVVTAWTLEDR